MVLKANENSMNIIVAYILAISWWVNTEVRGDIVDRDSRARKIRKKKSKKEGWNAGT